MRTLIDGYNLMHARGLMQGKFAPDAFRKARHRFLADLAAAMDPVEAHQTTVVFDASTPPHNRPSRQKVKGIEVVFAVGDENADERIEKLIASHSAPRSLTVVSSDLRVRQAAERRRAKVVLSDDFLSGLSNRRRKPEAAPALSAEEQARNRGLSTTESAFWMAEFADLADEPGIKEGLRASDFVPTDDEIARIQAEIDREG
jgi:predicted RNA-binding protein with PIN domain